MTDSSTNQKQPARRRKTLRIMPSTQLAVWSLWLIVLFVAVLASVTLTTQIFNLQGGETFTDNLFVSKPMLVAMGVAICAFVIGVLSVARYKERSLIVAIPILLGLVVVIYLLGELVITN